MENIVIPQDKKRSRTKNGNIKEYYTTLYDVLNQLRFKRVDFKWYSMETEYSYYTIDSPQDSE